MATVRTPFFLSATVALLAACATGPANNGKAHSVEAESPGEVAEQEELAQEPEVVSAPNVEPVAAPDTPDAMAVDAYGQLVAVAYKGGRVVLLDSLNGSEVMVLPLGLGEDPWDLEFAPDGGVLAGIGHSGNLQFWSFEKDGPEGEVVATASHEGFLDLKEPGPWPFVTVLNWSPDGQRLLATHTRGKISLWSRGGELIKRWSARQTFRTDEATAWSRSGDMIFYAQGKDVVIRDGVTGELLDGDSGVSRLTCEKPVVSLAVHPTLDQLATGHRDCELGLWDLNSGELLVSAHHRDETFPEPEEEIASIAWSPSGERLAVSIRESCTVFEVGAQDLTKIWSSGFLSAHFGEAMPVRWGPNGRNLWFAFECGGANLMMLDPSSDASYENRETGLVPDFSGTFCVTISGGKVHLMELDGETRWKN